MTGYNQLVAWDPVPFSGLLQQQALNVAHEHANLHTHEIKIFIIGIKVIYHKMKYTLQCRLLYLTVGQLPHLSSFKTFFHPKFIKQTPHFPL